MSILLVTVFLLFQCSRSGYTTLQELNMTELFAGEYRWVIRQFSTNFFYPRVPRRIFTKACGDTLYVSYTGVNAYINSTFGRLVKLKSNPDIGTWKVVEENSFPECDSMFDISLTSDCSQLYALCRRSRPFPHLYLNESITDTLAAIGAKKDLMWEFDPPPFANGFRHPNTEVNTFSFLMLYQFASNSVRSSINKYIIHRGQGGVMGNVLMEVYGNDTLLHFYTQADMCVMTNPTNCHSGDSAYTIDLRKMSFDYTYGDDWAIGGGHPFMQRLSFNPYLGRVLQVGATDLSTVFFRLDNKRSNTGDSVKFNMYQQFKWRGGPGGVTYTKNGWIATICNAVTPEGNKQQINEGIGLVFLDANATVTNVKWIERRTGPYLGQPNIIGLPNGRFLVGWTALNESALVPSKYFLVEVDANGNKVSEVKELTQGGWGEQDAWTLFNGHAVFAFTWKKGSSPIYPINGEYLGPNSKEASKKLGITTYFVKDSGYVDPPHKLPYINIPPNIPPNIPNIPPKPKSSIANPLLTFNCFMLLLLAFLAVFV